LIEKEGDSQKKFEVASHVREREKQKVKRDEKAKKREKERRRAKNERGMEREREGKHKPESQREITCFERKRQ